MAIKVTVVKRLAAQPILLPRPAAPSMLDPFVLIVLAKSFESVAFRQWKEDCRRRSGDDAEFSVSKNKLITGLYANHEKLLLVL